jgi:hypothetical protein
MLNGLCKKLRLYGVDCVTPEPDQNFLVIFLKPFTGSEVHPPGPPPLETSLGIFETFYYVTDVQLWPPKFSGNFVETLNRIRCPARDPLDFLITPSTPSIFSGIFKPFYWVTDAPLDPP